jgi:hypothetical protein
LSGSFSGDFRAVAALTEIIVSLLKQADKVVVIMVHMARAGHTSMVAIGLRISILNGAPAKL